MADHPDPLDWLEAERLEAGGSRVAFRQQLGDIDRLLIDLGERVAGQIEPVTRAFLEGDAYRMGDQVASRRAVDRGCEQLEEACYVLLARQQPVAGDLRHVVAVLRSVQDVQRSGNLLQHVGQSLQWVHPPSLSAELRETIGQLGEVSAQVFSGGVAAWRDEDPLAASELMRADDQADLLQQYLLTELYTGHQSVEEAVSLALIARYYERIADHGVEMARQLSYRVTGERPSDPEGDRPPL
ncbi:phosphate uptake regulator PhoU [Egibacter rhizosphaerae]|uniref:Phosphate uptake regulator PhoU n=1 Tax=Egibacter rhizosphaerae TaxID=1670831 RepID=A0A411YIN2_9ACTN|nr:phosphate uptake regulator PhoU [Egibacter rhizosphaerae]QBI21154.1 phosphate uptake regulator PhoU [Egibacter rhizosphaerae]